MEIIFLILLASLMIWAIVRCVLVLSILFLLTPEYCKLYSIHLVSKYPVSVVFKFTMLLITISLLILNPSVVFMAVAVSMYSGAVVSISSRRKLTVNISMENKKDDED